MKRGRDQSEGRKSELWRQEWAFTTLFAVLWYISKMSTIKIKNVSDIAVVTELGGFLLRATLRFLISLGPPPAPCWGVVVSLSTKGPRATPGTGEATGFRLESVGDGMWAGCEMVLGNYCASPPCDRSR